MVLVIHFDQTSTFTVFLLNWVSSPRHLNNFEFPSLFPFSRQEGDNWAGKLLLFGSTNVTLFLEIFSHYIFLQNTSHETLVPSLLLIFNEACSWNWRPERANLMSLSWAVNLYIFVSSPKLGFGKITRFGCSSLRCQGWWSSWLLLKLPVLTLLWYYSFLSTGRKWKLSTFCCLLLFSHLVNLIYSVRGLLSIGSWGRKENGSISYESSELLDS